MHREFITRVTNKENKNLFHYKQSPIQAVDVGDEILELYRTVRYLTIMGANTIRKKAIVWSLPLIAQPNTTNSSNSKESDIL